MNCKKEWKNLAVIVGVVLVTLFLGQGWLVSADTAAEAVQDMQATVADSAAAAESGILTLSRAIELALENNPGLSASAYDVDAAAAVRDLAAGARLPGVSLRGGYQHYLDDQRLVPARRNGEPGVFADGIFSGDIVLSMPLYTGGRIRSEIRAAELLQAAAEYRLSRTRDELVYNVASVFYSIAAQKEVVAALEFAREMLTAHRRRVNDLISGQKAARVDLLRTEVRLANLEQQLVREMNVRSLQLRVLKNLLGLPVEATEDLNLAGELPVAELTVPVLSEQLAAAYARRPDYLAARNVFASQVQRLDMARAGRLPTVSLQGAYGARTAVGAENRPDGTSTTEDAGRIGVVLDFPLFDGGRVRAVISRERARLEAERERLRGLELKIGLEVESAVLNLSAAAQRIEAIGKALSQADESWRIEREKYELGKGTIVDVLDAQAAYLDSQTNYYRALADQHTAAAQLKLVTGVQP